MKSRIFQRLALLALAAVLSVSAQAQVTQERTTPAPVLDRVSPNAMDVVKLRRSGVSDPLMLTYIESVRGRFNLTAEDITQLKRAGLSQAVIAAMLKHDRAVGPGVPAQAAPPRAKAPVVKTAPRQADVAPAMEKSARTRGYADSIADPSPQPLKKKTRKFVVEQRPPAPKPEIVPLTPAPDYYWTAGYWTWSGGQWVWQNGKWIHDPGHGAKWVGGHWAKHGKGYIFIEGHWLY